MGTLTFPFTLNPGALENVNQLNANLAAIATVLNGQVDSVNLAALGVATGNINDLAVTTAKLAALAVTTAKMADGNVTAAKIEAQPAWSQLTLSGSGWPSSTLNYYKDSLGRVHFRGDVLTTTSGSVTAGTTLGTMPAGSRPVSTQRFSAIDDIFNSAGVFQITSAGVISNVVTLSSGTRWSFNTSYRAEN